MTFPLYGFTGDHVIPKGIIKLAVIVGDHPRTSTVVVEVLTVDCPSAFNGVIRRPFLKALKAMVLISCLKIKFPIATGTKQVQGRQYDSRECYNKSLELAKKERELPRMMEVERVTKVPMETNTDPCLQEEESTARPIEELVEILMDPWSQAESSRSAKA